MGKDKIGKKIGTKVRPIEIAGGQETIVAPLEVQIKTLTESLNTGIAALFFGDKNAGSDPIKSINAYKNHAQKTILGNSNSIYKELEEIKLRLPQKQIKDKVWTNLNNSTLALSKALSFDQGETLYSLLSYLKYLEPTNNSNNQYEGKVKFLVEGIDEDALDKLNELFKLGNQSNENLFNSLDTLFNIFKNFEELNTKKLGNLQTTQIAIMRLIPLLQSIKIADKLTPDIQTIIDFGKKIQNVFDSIKPLEGLDNNQIKELNDTIKFINHLILKIGLASFLANEKDLNTLSKFIGYIGKERKSGLNRLFYNISKLETIDSGRAEKLEQTTTWLENTIKSLSKISKIYKKDINECIGGFNGLIIPENGVLSKLFENVNYLQGIPENQSKEISNNINVINEIIEKLNKISKKYNDSKVFDFINSFSILLKTNKGQDLYNIFDKIKKIGEIKPDYSGILLNRLNIILEIVDVLNKIKVSKKLSKNIENLNEFLSGKKDSLNTIFNNLKELQDNIPGNNTFQKLNSAASSLNLLMTVFSEIAKNSKDAKKIEKNLEKYLKVIKESYEKLSEQYDYIISLEGKVDDVIRINKKIQEANEKTNEVVVQTSKNEKEVAKARVTMGEMLGFIIACATVMTIGALFVMLGGGKFIKAALTFGVILMTFEGLVLAPALMFAAIKQLAMPAMNEFSGFIIVCTFTMLLGAAFMLLGGGKFIKAALQFGLSLMLFETLVVAPMLIFSVIKPQAIPSLKEFTIFIVTCTFVMLLGGLFVNLGGGKYLKSALLFGEALMIFEAMVVAPMLLFGLMSDKLKDSLNDFTKFIITSSFVLIFGALFMMSKKLVEGAMKFAGLLFLFEIGTIAPFLLFRLVKDIVIESVKDFTKLILVSSFVLIFGAVFMQNKKLVKGAMDFTWLLIKFEIGVIAPFIIFNWIKPMATSGLKEFTKFIIVSAFCLILGAVFMQNKKFVQGAKEFKDLLLWFVLGMTIPFILYRAISQIAEKSMKEFTLLVVASTFCLLLGTLFMKMFGPGYVIGYALLLGSFVFAMSAIVLWLSNNMGPNELAKMEAFGMFILLSSVALGIGALFMTMFGPGYVIGYALLLGVFTLAMGAIIKFLLAEMNPLAIASMSAFGTFILLSSVALGIGAFFIEKYGTANVILYAVIFTGFIVLMSGLMALLTLIGTYIAPGIAVLGGIALTIGLMTGVFFLINSFFEKDPGGKIITKNISILSGILIGPLTGIYTSLMWYIIPAAIGGAAALAIGVSLGVLGTALGIVNLIIGTKGDQLKKNVLILNELLGYDYLGKTYASLGLLSLPIALGSIVAIAMSLSITLLGGALSLVNLIMGNNSKKIEKNIIALNTIIGKLSEVYDTIDDKFGLFFLAKVGAKILAISGLTLALTSSMIAISASIESMKKVGDISKYSEGVIRNICAFFGIINHPDIVEFIDKIDDYEDKIDVITGICIPMAKMMSKLSKSVKDMADMKIAISWDAKGKPTAYRHLKDKDFNLMTRNVKTVVTSMTSAIMEAYTSKIEGTDKSLADLVEDDDILKNVIKFNKELGNVIAGIAKGVGLMANLTVATKWDGKGHPIAFRQLKDKDFINAQRNVGRIVTNLTQALIEVYTGNESMFEDVDNGLFRSNTPSPLRKVIAASMEISTLIGGIGKAIADMAKLTIPTKWEDGKAVAYRTLKPQDFTQASINIQTILTTMFDALLDLYNKGTNFGVDGKNVFDMDSEDSGLLKVIDASMKISELIANVGEGIQAMSKMMVADQWDKKTGKPIHFRKLTSTDFTDAAESIRIIMTTTAEALKAIDIDPDDTKEIIEALLPTSQLVANMADGILKLATGQIADNWDRKTGKPIHFKEIKKEDYENVAIVIGDLLTSIADSLVKAYNGEKGKKGLRELIEGKDFKETVEAFTGVSSIVANMADGVIKFATAQVPDRWDKDGKAIHYKDIKNWKEIQGNLTSVLNQIITCVATSVIDVYKNNEQLFEGGEESPFVIAVNGIQGITKVVSGIVDSVVKIGSAQIPIHWDKDGKPDFYMPIDVNKAIKDIKKIFEGNNGDGLLSILCTEMFIMSKLYFEEGSPLFIGNTLESITSGLESILNVVKSSVQIITDVANLKIPTGFDKDGKATGYKKFNTSSMDIVKENIACIISSLFLAVDSAWTGIGDVKNRLKLNDNGESSTLNTITASIEAILDVVSSAVGGINELLTEENSISKIMNYQGIYTENINNENIKIGLFKDIYGIMLNVNELSKLFDTSIPNSLSSIINLELKKETVDKINDNLSNIDSLINMIVSNFIDIQTIFDDNKDKLSNVLTNGANDLYTTIDNIIFIYSQIAASLLMTTLFDPTLINKNANNINTSTSLMNSVLSALIDNYVSLNNQLIGIKEALENKQIINDSIKTILELYRGSYKNGIKEEGLLYYVSNFFTETYSDLDKQISTIRKFSLLTTLLIQQLLANTVMIMTSYSLSKPILDEYTNNHVSISDLIINIINDIVKINNSIASNNLENNFDNIIKPINSFFKFMGNSEEGFIKNITDIIKQVNSNELIKGYDKNEETKLSTLLSPVIEDIVKVYNLLGELDSTTKGASLFGIKLTSDKNIIQSSKQFKESIEILVNAMETSKGITKTLIDSLQTNLSTLADIFNIKIETNWKGKTNLEIMNEPLNEYVGIVIKFDDKAFVNSNKLSSSIDKIYKVTSSQKGTKMFQDNTKTLEKYVKSINSIEVKKLSPLVMLVSELNELSNKMGNLDGLTNAIADKLASVLNELVEKLEDSKNTIETADRIQDKRYRMINETVGKVQEIMSRPFNVEISNSEQDPSGEGNDPEQNQGDEESYSYDDMKKMGYGNVLDENTFKKAAGSDGKLTAAEARDFARRNTKFKDTFKYTDNNRKLKDYH